MLGRRRERQDIVRRVCIEGYSTGGGRWGSGWGGWGTWGPYTNAQSTPNKVPDGALSVSPRRCCLPVASTHHTHGHGGGDVDGPHPSPSGTSGRQGYHTTPGSHALQTTANALGRGQRTLRSILMFLVDIHALSVIINVNDKG